VNIINITRGINIFKIFGEPIALHGLHVAPSLPNLEIEMILFILNP
jgi:hypothetical protein